jgi:hypothetical protein
VLSSWIVPPWASAMTREIASPRPLPGIAFSIAFVPRKNR